MEQKLKINIYKDVVIGFTVSQSVAGKHRYIHITPLIANHEGLFDDEPDSLGTNEQVVGVLPAPPNTFRIMGGLPRNEAPLTYLGYDFAGATNPDWANDCVGDVVRDVMLPELKKIVRKITDDNHGEAPLELIQAAVKKVPLFNMSRACYAWDDEERIHELLTTLVFQGRVEYLRDGVYRLL